MSKATRVVEAMPAEASADEAPDSEVIDFRAKFEDRSPLDELIREGARRMLQSAIGAEVDDFIAGHAQRMVLAGRSQWVAARTRDTQQCREAGRQTAASAGQVSRDR